MVFVRANDPELSKLLSSQSRLVEGIVKAAQEFLATRELFIRYCIEVYHHGMIEPDLDEEEEFKQALTAERAELMRIAQQLVSE